MHRVTTMRVPRQTNHSLHLILTMISCGMWAPIWFCVWLFNALSDREYSTTTTTTGPPLVPYTYVEGPNRAIGATRYPIGHAGGGSPIGQPQLGFYAVDAEGRPLPQQPLLRAPMTNCVGMFTTPVEPRQCPCGAWCKDEAEMQSHTHLG